MAWLEAVTYLATLTYKFFRGDSEERGQRRRREEVYICIYRSRYFLFFSTCMCVCISDAVLRNQYYDSYGTEWNSQYPYGSQQFDDSVYGHEVEYYEQSGSEKRRHGKPEEQWYSYRIRDQSGDTEIDGVRRRRVEKKKRRGHALCRRVDYEERGMITKRYVDRRGKQVIEQKPYSSWMYEENQYLPVVGGDEEGIGTDADASWYARDGPWRTPQKEVINY
ncbi:hypothetical protein COCNU_03G016180 [Cocos nucifera]|uniref:Uncharacterized protein n=1 Tax=Cocos nucifera TaxID=13894 RepID=A0A8K0I4X8_COCNU|nr:hypothetical protein COCNU_03G016180 [Cocos nucifera]